jgi:hypothetical protein
MWIDGQIKLNEFKSDIFVACVEQTPANELQIISFNEKEANLVVFESKQSDPL